MTRVGILGNPFLRFLTLVAERGFPSLSAKQLVKSASTFLSAFRLLPRLEEVYIPWLYTPAATLRRKVVYQLAPVAQVVVVGMKRSEAERKVDIER